MVAGVAGMVPGRGVLQAVQVGIHRLAGRIHLTLEDPAQGRHAAGACAGCQDHRADVRVIVDPAQLHGVVGVDDHDYFFKAAVFSRAQTAYLSDRTLYRWYIRGNSRSHTVIYIEDYFEKANLVCQYEINELICYVVKRLPLDLSEYEIDQIRCDKY